MGPWDGLPGEGPWLHTGKNSRVSHSKVKADLLREIHTPWRECGPSQKARGGRGAWGGLRK